jgi:CRP-like cAMP-binding protein
MSKTRRTTAQKAADRSDPLEHPRNKLLAALPAADCQRLLPLLEQAPLKHGQMLQASGERLRTIYFPGDGVSSMVKTMQDGRMVEVATIGREGMTGIGAVFGARNASSDIVVQIPAALAYAMPVEVFRAEMARRGPLHQVVSQYAHALLGFVMQSAACNGLHAADERCARWLLHCHDRVEKNTFALTQELLAVMLGVRRATVTVVASEFQREQLVAFGRRQVTILDRAGLEGRSCECYRAMKAQFDRLGAAGHAPHRLRS